MRAQDAGYSIAGVSKLSGVSCHTLRVWERRYGFPSPRRTLKGHRRYDRAQVQVLCEVGRQVREGRSVGEVIGDLRAGRAEAAVDAPTDPEHEVETLAAAMLECLLSGDCEAGERCYRDLEQRLDPVELAARVIGPALIETGERWFRRESDVYQERCVSVFLRRRLAILIESARALNVNPMRRLVVGAVQGDRHEGGVLILNLLLEIAGWRVINLGVDLPVREFEKAVQARRPDGLALSFVLSRNINKRFRELRTITEVPVFVGGRGVLNYQSLARRHALIPLACPVPGLAARIELELESWRRARGVGVAAEQAGRESPAS